MKQFNDTPYSVSHAHSILQPEEPFITVAIKAAFRIEPDGTCAPLPAELQPKVGKAANFKDRHGNSLKWDNDLVAFKPRADCIFIGSAHTPDGEPRKEMTVGFGVGDMRKHLSIHGDRHWMRMADGSVELTEPAEFTEMPIREERAHGGPQSKFNKHGIGFRSLGEAPGSRVPVANIVDLGAKPSDWTVDRPSAGFGAIPKTLLPRRSLAGTFDDDWRYRRQPLPPADFDPGFLNSARPDQQIEGYLVGDEELVFENLHPTQPVLKSRLPGLRIRCFVNRRLDPTAPDDLEFAEIITLLDTCIVDMPNATATLIWRGTMEIQAAKHGRVTHLLVCQEPLQAPLDVEYYADLMIQKIDASTLRPSTGLTPEERQERIDKLNAEGMTRILAMLKKGKADPAIIAKVEEQSDMNGVMSVVQAWVEEMKAGLPSGVDPSSDAD